MDDQTKFRLVTLVVALGLVAYTGHAMVTSPNVEEFYKDSEAWCDAHNGTLQNSRVVGEHGGLHCKLPNGTSVHMDEVVNVSDADA